MAFPKKLIGRLEATRLVAGFSVEKVEHAVPLAKALMAGGLNVTELTLRTPVAMDAIRAIRAEVPDVVLGVGTILTPEQAVEVKEAGADFGVAPGVNPRVVTAAAGAGLPFAPGIATPSELEAAIELGCRFVKLFPAGALGGISYLRSMAAPYKHLGIQYLPLGGVNADNMHEYLNEPNVTAVGGSWIVKQSLVDAEDWEGLTAHAAELIEALGRNEQNE